MAFKQDRARELQGLLSNPGKNHTTYDAVLSEVAQLTDNWDLNKNLISVDDRVKVAYHVLDAYIKQSSAGSQTGRTLAYATASANSSHSAKGLSKDLSPMVKDPEKYGLSEDDVLSLSESMYHITGKEALDPSVEMAREERIRATKEALEEMSNEKLHDYKLQTQDIEQMKGMVAQVASVQEIEDPEEAQKKGQSLMKKLKEKNQDWRDKKESIASQALRSTEQKAEKKAAVAAMKTKIQAAATQLGNAVTTAIPIPVLGKFAGLLISKVIGPAIAWLGSTVYGFLVKNKKTVDAATAGGAILGGMALGGPIGVMIALGGLFLSGNFWVKGAILGSLAFLAALAAMLVTSLLLGTLASFFLLIGFVGFILLIITNSAYVVPPSSTILTPCTPTEATASAQLPEQAPTTSATVIKIMPLGDSITAGVWGATSTPGYREILKSKLDSAGIKTEFVGSQTIGGGGKHEGHPNQNATWLAERVGGWMDAAQPDVVLLHTGTVNFITQFDQNIASVDTIISTILSKNQNTKIYLARIIRPYVFDQTGARTKQYNDRIVALTRNHPTVQIVDMESALTYPGDLTDGSHPTPGGFEKMAERWFTALGGQLSASGGLAGDNPCAPVGEGCPSGWPVLPFAGRRPLTITQGSRGAWSHVQAGLEALDISAGTGTPVTVTHSGVVWGVYTTASGAGSYDNYGRIVIVEGNCDGTRFYSMYAHLTTIGVVKGQTVSQGMQIGSSGMTGTSAPHLHYEFRVGKMASNTAGPAPNGPKPFMYPPYIPKPVPPFCDNPNPNCNTFVP